MFAIEQVLATVVLLGALTRMIWLVARPPHHTEGYWGNLQLRVDGWLAGHHAQPKA